MGRPSAPRRWPAITTHNHDNHGIRTEHWRYIRYADQSEELYDIHKDPHQWHNRADDVKLQHIRDRLSQWIPHPSRPPAPGSAHRILTYQKSLPGQKRVAIWEGNAIGPEDPIPGIEKASQ